MATAEQQTSLVTKLKTILDKVSTQENILTSKVQQIEQWYGMHQTALANASAIKQKLIEFEPTNEESDSDDVTAAKLSKKNAINTALDNLSEELKLISESESHHRSMECKQELAHKQALVAELSTTNRDLHQSNQSLVAENSALQPQLEAMRADHEQVLNRTKKDIYDRHKEYVSHLQSQHETALNAQRSEMNAEQQTQMELQLNELRASLETEFGSQLVALRSQCDTLQSQTTESDDLLSSYVELDKQHQTAACEWKTEKEQLAQSMAEMKQTAMKTTDKLLQVQNECNQLQSHAVKHNLKALTYSSQIDKLSLEIMQLKTTQQRFDAQCRAKDERYEALCKEHNQVKQERAVLVKEVKKLRRDVQDMEHTKSEILTKMSANEMEHRGHCRKYEEQIATLKQKYIDVLDACQSVLTALTDCNSNIESFGDTINNFSSPALIDSYDTEYEARCKSTQLLNDTLSSNIHEEIIRLHREMNVSKLRNQLQSINIQNGNENHNENELKKNEMDENKTNASLFDDLTFQIDHIRLATLKLLMEYIECIKNSNELYVRYNPPAPRPENGNGADASMLDYVSNVTANVASVASMVNPFNRWPIAKRGNGQQHNYHEDDDADESDDDDGADGNDAVATHYLARSAFLSVEEQASN